MSWVEKQLNDMRRRQAQQVVLPVSKNESTPKRPSQLEKMGVHTLLQDIGSNYWESPRGSIEPVEELWFIQDNRTRDLFIQWGRYGRYGTESRSFGEAYQIITSQTDSDKEVFHPAHTYMLPEGNLEYGQSGGDRLPRRPKFVPAETIREVDGRVRIIQAIEFYSMGPQLAVVWGNGYWHVEGNWSHMSYAYNHIWTEYISVPLGEENRGAMMDVLATAAEATRVLVPKKPK